MQWQTFYCFGAIQPRLAQWIHWAPHLSANKLSKICHKQRRRYTNIGPHENVITWVSRKSRFQYSNRSSRQHVPRNPNQSKPGPHPSLIPKILKETCGAVPVQFCASCTFVVFGLPKLRWTVGCEWISFRTKGNKLDVLFWALQMFMESALQNNGEIRKNSWRKQRFLQGVRNALLLRRIGVQVFWDLGSSTLFLNEHRILKLS